jgi:4-amino-4-deoxy-L-arabinose transferase-like glycosyltransferase
VVRLAYWAIVTPRWTPVADADQYVQLSHSLADGRGFGLVFPQFAHHPTAFRPPLYPLLLTPTAWLFGDALWPGRLLNVVLGTVVVVLAAVLAARIGGRRAGLATGAMVAVYPPLLANDTITLTEPLGLALLLAAALLIEDRRWVWGGVATGCILLTRPNGYLVVAILAAWAAARLGRRAAVGVVLVALAVFTPWLVRNAVQVGTWRPTTSDGFTLAAIYAEPAQRAHTFVDPVYASEYDDARHRWAQFDEAAWSEVLSADATEGLRSHPGYVLTVVGRNARGFFEISPGLNRWPEWNDGRNAGFRDRTRPLFYVVTVVGLIGLARYRRDRRVIVLAALVAQFVLLSLVLVAPPRLRAPFDLLMCVGVGLALADATAGRTPSRTADPTG